MAPGGQALCVPADGTSEPSIKEAFRTIRERLGDVEVLVWNAGGRTSWPPAKLVDTPTDQFETNMKVGCTGAFIASKEVVPAMTAQKKGTILLTGATASLRGGKSFYNLAVHKFALRALAQCMARELMPEGIHVAHISKQGNLKTTTYTYREGGGRPLVCGWCACGC